MQITRVSLLTGESHTFDLPIDDSQMARWYGGETLEKCMPHLSDAERDFLISGITPEECRQTFGDREAWG